jgi:hypothetical protein
MFLTMVLYYCDLLFGLYPSSLCFATTTFRGMDLPSSSVKPTLLGPVDRASLYRWILSTKHAGHTFQLCEDLAELQNKEIKIKLNYDSRIKWDEAKAIQKEPNTIYRKYMAYLENTISQPSLEMSPFWLPVIKEEIRIQKNGSLS